MSTTGGNTPENTSQFWDDFWNTIYQFTHPFSSTFFDSLLKGDESNVAESASEDKPSNQATESPGTGAYRFKDEASFKKFWDNMKTSKESHNGNPSTPMEHVQEAWNDIRTTAVGPNPLAALLFLTILLAALSEPLNGVAGRHWQQFSDDNYFDSHGVFTSVVWSAPLLGNALLGVLLLLRTTAGLLIKVKKAQLQENKRKKQK
ncbi:hypothetical protein BGZ46_001713 [Entomortierella lignicola]|nr:hypothetical protein BGZ46_001713 [Entomortierella lignicola]